MKKKGRKIQKKEDYSEDWCFDCKDGGDLIICDHKDCSKSYHPDCVKFAKTKIHFICELHRCYVCGRASDIHCYCCPKGVCRRCIRTVDFVHVRGKKGFCDYCLKLALLVEEKKDVDSDGESIDFNNRNTYETLYKEYWEIINATEKLTLERLVSAKAQLESGDNYNSDNYDDSNDEYQVSDDEDKDGIESCDPGRKRKRTEVQPSRMKGETKSNKKEFMGWGSKRLMRFLTTMGKDTTHILSQRKLETIIKGYIKENKLLRNKKTVECDVWLQSIFGRKTVKLNRIYDLLESHLAENQEPSDEEKLGYDSEDKDDDADDNLVVFTKKKTDKADKILQKEEAGLNVPRFHFVAVVPKNIMLVYLRRTLVQKLEKEPESFEGKVIGCFVRVKGAANDCFSRSSYQLMQVTGVRKCLVGENDQTVVLQALDMDISINALSDDDFSEEECQELRNKMKSGVLKKLTLVALEQKARSLHEDIVTHWIPRELALLKHRIDQANEKGWRRELFEYLQRRQFLQDPSNRSKLLQKVPTVVPDVEDVGSIEDNFEGDKEGNKDSPKSNLMHVSELPRENLKSKEISSEEHVEEVTPTSETLAAGERRNNSKASAVNDVDQETTTSQLSLSGSGDDEKSTIDLSKEEVEDTESSRWYITNSNGENRGPVSLSVLKNWSHTQAASEFKIYKASQSKEQAIPLTAVIRRAFPTT